MSQFTPSSLGEPIPSGTQPDFSYNLFGGLQPVEIDNQKHVLRYTMPDEFAQQDELRRKQEEIANLRLFAAFDKNDPNFKTTTTVGKYEIPTYIGMRTGAGIGDNLTRETAGEQEFNLSMTAGSGVRGMFAEQNREFSRKTINTFNSDATAYPFDANTAYDWARDNLSGSFGSWLKSVGELIAWTDTSEVDRQYFNVEQALKTDAKDWTPDLASEATNKFLNSNPELSQYFELSGVDPHQFTRLSNNPIAWVFQMNQAVIQAQSNVRMQMYEEETGTIGGIADKLYYGVKDPTMIRDLVVTALASYGLATTETGLARLATTGLARSTGAAGAIDNLSLAVGKYGVRGISGGPLTGPVENLIYQTSKLLVPSVGTNGFNTAVARSVAIMGEAATWSALGAAQMQKEDYRFKHLILNFGEYAPEFKYDMPGIYQAAYEGGLLGLAAFGTMRTLLGGLHDIGAVRQAKPGEKLATLSRQIANSLDSYAVTKEGRTVFGNKLGNSRGIAFGNWLDNSMKGLDNRNTASILVNGKALYHFDGFTPEVISKANFNEAKSREIVDLWAKVTNTVETPEGLYDPEVLASKGLTYDQVIETLKTFNKAIEIGVEARKSMPRGMFESIKPYAEFDNDFINKVSQDSADVQTRAILKDIVKEWRQVNEARTAKINKEKNKDLTELTDLEFEEKRAELSTKLSELEQRKANTDSKIPELEKEIEATKTQIKDIDSSISNLNQKGKHPNALKNIADALKATTKKLTDLITKQETDKASRIADIDKKVGILERRRAVYNGLPETTPDEVALKTRLLNDLIPEQEKLEAKRKKIESEKGATRKEQRELVNLTKEKEDLEKLHEQWLLKDKQETHLKTKEAELEAIKSEAQVKDSNGATTEEAIVSTKNKIDELDRVKRETAEYDAQVKDIKNRFDEARNKLNRGKDAIVFLGLTDKLRRLNELKERRSIATDPKEIKKLDRIIKKLEDFFETEDGVKEATRAKVIEDTINNNRGFGTANTIANIIHSLNVQSAFGVAEKNKISIKSITGKFKELTGKDIDYGNIKDLLNLTTIVNNLIGINHINNADSIIKTVLDFNAKKAVSENGGIVSGSKIVDLFRTIVGKLDKREGAKSIVLFISDRDFTVTNQAKAGMNNLLKVTLNEDGTFSVDIEFGKLSTDKDGKVTGTKPDLFKDPELTADNVVEYNTFVAVIKEWQQAVDTIVKQADDKAVKFLSNTLEDMHTEIKEVLINAQIFSEEITSTFRRLLDSIEDGDVSTLLTQMKKTFDDQLTEAIASKNKEEYRNKYTTIISNMFALESIKDSLKEKVNAIKDPELKEKALKDLAALDDDKYSVTQSIQNYHTKPKKAKVSESSEKVEKTKPEGIPEDVSFESEPIKADTQIEPLVPTVDNLKFIFGLNDREAVLGSVIMQALGANVNKGLISNIGLQKGVNVGKDELARIHLKRVSKGIKAIIAANDGADLFSITHEMGHYTRYLFLDPRTSVEERAKIGITDGMYSKLMSWLGVEKDADGNYKQLSDSQEEKFANGFALYLMKLLQGDGKATNTGIQFAFNKLGEHLGDLGEKFKSAKNTKGIDEVKLTPEAEEVYSALLSKTSEDNITTIFMDGFKDVITDLSDDQKTLLGQRILGSMRWEKYKAEMEIKREAAAKPTSAISEVVAESRSVPIERVDTVADSVETPKVDITAAETPSAKVEAAAEMAATDAAITRLEVKADIDTEVATSISDSVDAIISRIEEPVVSEPVEVKTFISPKILKRLDPSVDVNLLKETKAKVEKEWIGLDAKQDGSEPGGFNLYVGEKFKDSPIEVDKTVIIKESTNLSDPTTESLELSLKQIETNPEQPLVRYVSVTLIGKKPVIVLRSILTTVDAIKAELEKRKATTEVKTETKETVTDTITERVRKPRKPRTKKALEETKAEIKEANTKVEDAAEKINEVKKEEEAVATTIVEEVRAIEPTAVPRVEEQIKQKIVPDLSFLGNRRSTTLDTAVSDFEKLRTKLSFLSSIIGETEVEDIIKFKELKKNPIYIQKETRGEVNPEFDIDANLNYISNKLKEELALDNGTEHYMGLWLNNKPLLITSSLKKLIKDTATKLGFKEDTFLMMVRATFAIEKSKTDHLMSLLKDKLARIEKKIAEGKKIQTADRRVLEQVKTIADIEEEAKATTIEKASPERMELAKVIFEAYDRLLRRQGVNDDAVNILYMNFISKDGLIKLIQEKLGDDFTDPVFLRNKLAGEPARVGDPIFNLLKGSINNLLLTEKRSSIGQRTVVKREVIDGEVKEVPTIEKFRKEGQPTVVTSKGEVNILERESINRMLGTEQPELSMNVEHASQAVRSGHVFASLFKFIQDQGDQAVLDFFVAKIQAIQEGHNTNYKSHIAKLFNMHNIKRNGTFDYTPENIKTLEEKSEVYISEWLDAIGKIEPTIAKAVREIIPGIQKRKPKTKPATVEDSASFAQAIKSLDYYTKSAGTKLIESVDWTKAQTVEKTIFDKFRLEYPKEKATIANLIKVIEKETIDEPEVQDILSLFKEANREILETSLVQIGKNVRASLSYIGNFVLLDEADDISVIFHELAHGVTVQYIMKYISKASNLSPNSLNDLSVSKRIEVLDSIKDKPEVPVEVQGIIKGYLYYLNKKFGSLEVLKGTKEIYLSKLIDMNESQNFVSTLTQYTFKESKDLMQRRGGKYGLLDNMHLIDETNEQIKQNWFAFREETISSVSPEETKFSISIAPKFVENLFNYKYSGKENVELKGKLKDKAVLHIIRRIEESRGFVEGRDYFIVYSPRAVDNQVKVIYTFGADKVRSGKGLFSVTPYEGSTDIFWNYYKPHFDMFKANTDSDIGLFLPDLKIFRTFYAPTMQDLFVAHNLPYAAGSIYEYISEVFTNGNHARFLDSIKLDGTLSEKSKIVDAVMRWWGIEGDPAKHTLLSNLLGNVDYISKQAKNNIAIYSTEDLKNVISFAQSKKIKTKESRAIKKAQQFRQDLKTSKGRWLVLATKLKQLINADIPNETEIVKVKEELNNVLATISVRRKGLKALGLSENFSDEDIAMASRLLEGLDPVDDISTRLGVENANRIITADILDIKDPEQKMEFVKAFKNVLKTKPEVRSFLRALEKTNTDPSFISKVADELAVTREDDEQVDVMSLRDMSTEQRRNFLINEFMPKIAESLGEKAGPQNILSKFFESVPGGSAIARQFQRRVGGSVSYGDTVNSPYLTLAFLAKILDPNVDVRNGELSGDYRLFSMEEAEAEAKLVLTSSGIPDILTEIQTARLNEEQLKALNSIAWRYLTKPEELPTDTPNYKLVQGLINARNKFNTMVSDYLKQYGGLGAKLEDPELYGTSHRPSLYAINNPDEFVKALTKHETNKFLNGNELNGATLHALGWIEITRANDDGHVDMVVIREDSPIAMLFDEKQITKKDAKRDKKITWGKAKKQLTIKDSEGKLRLPEETLNRYYDALQNVTEDYLPAWIEYYKNFENPTAIFVSMRTAKDRILRVPEGESDNKSLSPKTYFANKASDYTEERLFTHEELVGNEDLAKFFNDNILGLTIEEANVRLFQHVVTRKLTELFGAKLSFDDLLQFAKLAELNYVRDIDKVSVKERESFFRGWEKIRRSWLQKTHRLGSESSDYDPSFRWLMESSPGMIMALGGLSAGAKTVVSELPRSLLASDRNKSFVRQFIPNMYLLLKYTFGLNASQKRLELLKQASAIHWTRAVLEDTFSANYEHSAARHDYTGPVLGRQGWWRNLSSRWNALGEANKIEKTAANKASNVVAAVGWLGGGLLRWSNEMVNVISLHNAMHNIQTNIGNFRKLSIMLEQYGTELAGKSPRRAEFNKLARSCGISPEEALDLSRSGLLELDTINILHKALTKDYKFVTTEGLPDSSKLLKWTEKLPLDQQAKAKDAVYKLAGYIKTLARNTNTEPTLLDTRVTIDPVARTLRLYTQFGTSNTVQAIGRVRRSGNVALAKFVAGQFLMQVAGGLLISYLLNAGDEKETENEILSHPVAFMLSNAARMPVYGNYGWLFKLLITGAYQTYAHIAQDKTPKSMEKLDLPNVIDSPFQYRFDSMTKDFEKMPGLITRYMEGKPMTVKQREQAIRSIPFLDTMLMTGFINDALDGDIPKSPVTRSYNPSIMETKKQAIESPVRPSIQPTPMEPVQPVQTPRRAMPEPVIQPREQTNIPSRPVGLQGVSPELANLLERF